MNTDQHTTEEPGRRPFGFWLKLVDRRISEEMEALFAADGISRRDWRVLNLLADRADDERLAERLRAKPHSLHRLAERGWVAGFPPELTEEGREARDRLEQQVNALRERVAGAVPPEDFEVTLRSLESIARELGWDESQPLPRGGRGGRRFGGRRHDRGDGAEYFGRRHGFGHHGFGHHGLGGGHRFERGCDPREGFGHHRGHGPAHQDVHVHVHLHDGRDSRTTHEGPGAPGDRAA